MTELEQMTPNQRRALDAGLAALDTMAATWAAEVKLFEIAKHFASISDPDERATRIAAMVRQGFSEGAYRCYLDHKDASAKQAARIAELEAQIAAVAPAVDAQPVACARIYADNTCGLSWIAPAYSMLPVGEHNLYASAQSEGLRKDAIRREALEEAAKAIEPRNSPDDWTDYAIIRAGAAATIRDLSQKTAQGEAK